MIERDFKIIDLYLNHEELSIKDIANQFGISCQTVTRIARINNLPRRVGRTGVRLSSQNIQDIIIKYKKGISIEQIKKEYSISYARIINIVTSAKCEKVSYSKRANHNLIENYFSIIDTEDKAYWLGWLISDGSITHSEEKKKYQIELTLQEKDESILHLLENDLGVTNKIYTSNEQYKRFSLGCKQMVIDLAKLGITQNKTFIVQIPKINKNLYPALIRGLFDGDGGYTVYTRDNGQTCRELSFCGNEFIINWIFNTLHSEIPQLSSTLITDEASIKRVRWSAKKDIILIAQYIYKNKNNHFLQRKYELIQADTEVNF